MAPRHSPHDPLAWIKVPDVTEAEGFAIKAVAEGKASADQQRRAMRTIVRKICRVLEPTFVLDGDGGDRATSYVAGRQGVGHALLTIIDLPIEKLRQPDAAAREQI